MATDLLQRLMRWPSCSLLLILIPKQLAELLTLLALIPIPAGFPVPAPTLLTTLMLLLTGVLIARLSAGPLARWSVPSIVLELVMGFVLGKTVLAFSSIAPLSGLAELGVLTLFFQVGLEVRGDLLTTRRGSILRTVALSFFTPLLAYWPLSAWFGMTTPQVLLCLAALAASP